MKKPRSTNPPRRNFSLKSSRAAPGLEGFEMPDGSVVSSVDPSGRYYIVEMLEASIKARMALMPEEVAAEWKELAASSSEEAESRRRKLDKQYAPTREQAQKQLPLYPAHGKIMGIVPYDVFSERIMVEKGMSEIEVQASFKELEQFGFARRVAGQVLLTVPAKEPDLSGSPISS